MNKKLIITQDGSHTFFVPELNEHYHSIWGAIQESMHVFINNGFLHHETNPASILEVGFGTGLNTLLTFISSRENQREIFYEAIELFPLQKEETDLLNYDIILEKHDDPIFKKIHECNWGSPVAIDNHFTLSKINTDLIGYKPSKNFDIVYFDAFAPKVQPALWELSIFKTLYASLNRGGILVTYSAKGTVKRALKEAGFTVELPPGPQGKRHMIRATKA